MFLKTNRTDGGNISPERFKNLVVVQFIRLDVSAWLQYRPESQIGSNASEETNLPVKTIKEWASSSCVLYIPRLKVYFPTQMISLRKNPSQVYPAAWGLVSPICNQVDNQE